MKGDRPLRGPWFKVVRRRRDIDEGGVYIASWNEMTLMPICEWRVAKYELDGLIIERLYLLAHTPDIIRIILHLSRGAVILNLIVKTWAHGVILICAQEHT
jgi:hypothetical protein